MDQCGIGPGIARRMIEIDQGGGKRRGLGWRDGQVARVGEHDPGSAY